MVKVSVTRWIYVKGVHGSFEIKMSLSVLECSKEIRDPSLSCCIVSV